MARLSRYTQKLFGSSAGPDQVAQFGSLFAGSPAFTTNPGVMMALSNWLTGWAGAAIGGNSPAIEDMNAVCTVLAYQLGYIMQSGVPEWDSGTTYYTGNIVNDGTGALYVSLQDTNLNNAVTDPLFWTLVAGKVMTDLGDLTYGGTNGALTRLAGNVTTAIQFLIQQGTGTTSAAPSWRSLLPPKITTYISGSGTHTFTGNPLYVSVEMVGGGGGGAGSGTAGGSLATAGGNTTFGSGLLAANGGNAGLWNSSPLAGGTASKGAADGIAITGGAGGVGLILASPGTIAPAGGTGGVSAFGGAGSSAFNAGLGIAATANSGSGGGGGGGQQTAGLIAGNGGAAGGYVKAWLSGSLLSGLSGSAPYAVGAKGNAGGAGTSGFVGYDGGAGIIVITEYYQ